MILKVYYTVIHTMRVSPTLAKILVAFPSTSTNPRILVALLMAITNSTLKVSTARPPRERRHPRMPCRMAWWGAPPPGAHHANPLV